MVNIQTREITAELTSLVKQVDALVGDPSDSKVTNKSFVVLITDDPDSAAEQLTGIAEKEGIKNTPLTIFDGVAGPGGYNIAKEAAVTVMIWKKGKVTANHAFEAGKLDKDAIAKIIADAKDVLD